MIIYFDEKEYNVILAPRRVRALFISKILCSERIKILISYLLNSFPDIVLFRQYLAFNLSFEKHSD
jgi:hypothetical protein